MIALLTFIGLYLMIGNAIAVFQLPNHDLDNMSQESRFKEYVKHVLIWPETIWKLR